MKNNEHRGGLLVESAYAPCARKEARRMSIGGRWSVRPGERLERKRRSHDSHLRSLTGAPRLDPVTAATHLLARRPHHCSHRNLLEDLDHAGGLLPLADLVDPHPERLGQQLRLVERADRARTTCIMPHVRTRPLARGERSLDVAADRPIGTLLNQHEHKQLLAHRNAPLMIAEKRNLTFWLRKAQVEHLGNSHPP